MDPKEEIMAMSAGPDVDKEVFEKVMGKTGEDVPAFSTDISAASTMEERVLDMEGHVQVGYVSRMHEVLGLPFKVPLTVGKELRLIHATPLERCKAALMAVQDIY